VRSSARVRYRESREWGIASLRRDGTRLRFVKIQTN
jgi:hypothetical protein